MDPVKRPQVDLCEVPAVCVTNKTNIDQDNVEVAVPSIDTIVPDP